MVETKETLTTVDEQSEVVDSTREELGGLKEKIGLDKRKDKEKFDKLSKDPILKKGLEKIYNKCCNIAFSKEWKEFEKKNVKKILDNIIKKYPSLWFQISGILGLPLGEANFNRLTAQQKVSFMVLYNSVYSNKLFNKKNPTAADIENRIKGNMNFYIKKLNDIFKRTNYTNIGKIDKTLQSDFGLNNIEITRVKEYMELVKKHPEYLDGMKIDFAGGKLFWTWIVSVVVAFALGTFLGIQFYKKTLPDPESITILGGRTEIKNPERVFKYLTQESKFRNSGDKEVRMFSVRESDGLVKRYVKQKLNNYQNRKVKMEVEGILAMQFDLGKGCEMVLDINEKNEGILYVRLPKPDVVITESQAKVLEEDLETFQVNAKEFRNMQQDLLKELKEQAISDAKADPNFYEHGKKDVANQLKDQISTYYAPIGIDIVDVKVEFFDPEKNSLPNKPETPTVKVN